MDRITDDLYIGDIQDAGRADWLRDGSPTAVLKLTPSDPEQPYPDDLTVAEVPMIDGPQNDYTDFERATETLLEFFEADHVVFVHCAAGISRSGSVASAALALRHGIDVEEAIERVRARRPAVHPHPHLRGQAQRFVDAR